MYAIRSYYVFRMVATTLCPLLNNVFTVKAPKPPFAPVIKIFDMTSVFDIVPHKGAVQCFNTCSQIRDCCSENFSSYGTKSSVT